VTRVDIAAADDPRLADYVALRDASLRISTEAQHGIFIAEGAKVVRRAVTAGHRIRSMLMAPRWLDTLADVIDEIGDVPVFVAPDDVIEQVTGFHVHRGALASMYRAPVPSLESVLDGVSSMRSRIAVLEDLVDHANVGAAFRNAAALGVDAVLLSPRCADPLYRRAVKVSMGAVLQIPWTRVENWPAGLGEVRQRGYDLAGMTLADDAITLDALVERDPPKLAVIFGTEASA